MGRWVSLPRVGLYDLAGNCPSKGSAWRLVYLEDVGERHARVNEAYALLCHDASCLHNILLLFGTDAGDSTRLFLRDETCLEMENMVYYSCLLQ